MNTRKRQRPSARDFFDRPPEPTRLVENTPSELVTYFQSNQNQPDLNQYQRSLSPLTQTEQILELIRGKHSLELVVDPSPDHPPSFLFIFKSNDHHHPFPNPIDHILKASHIARILWGPGKREVAHGKKIFLGPLTLPTLLDGQSLKTDEVYAIQFSNPRAADLAAQTVQFKLDQFLVAVDHPLRVQVRAGSARWFVHQDRKSMDEAEWKVQRKKIPFLRPLPTLEPAGAQPHTSNHLDLGSTSGRPAAELAFEISQLPKSVTVPALLNNLIKFRLLEFPTLIKLTEENNSETPVRILLKFPCTMSTKICKFHIFHCGLKPQSEPDLKDQKPPIIQFIIDEGDSSILDSWNIWAHAQVWDQQSIKDYLKASHRAHRYDKPEDDKENIDELEDTKPEGFGSDELDEWASNHPRGGDVVSEGERRQRQQSYQQKLAENEREWEQELEKVTELAEEEYEARRAAQGVRATMGSAGSRFYQASREVTENKQFNRLLELIQTRARRRRQTKLHRKPLPVATIRRQERAVRRGQRADDDAPASDDPLESTPDQSDFDEPDDRQRAAFSNQQWRSFRLKKRARRILEPNSSDDDHDNERVLKSLVTHDDTYRHKFARPNEPAPGNAN